MDRHVRQARLLEVGVSGQERIGRADVTVPFVGLAGAVAARYLAGAGVGRLRLADDAVARHALATDASVRVDVDVRSCEVAGPSPFRLRDRVADDVARGAHAALVALRRAMEMER
jgi:hypothetical protein